MRISSGIIEYEKHFNVTLSLTIEKFNECGFELGDSINVYFDSGYSIMDIPYYNGFYCPVDEVLVCAYPGYATIDIARNQGSSLYEEAGVNPDTIVTLELNEKGRYLNIQNMMNLDLSTDRDNYDSDERFSNSRVVNYPGLKENLLYRSCSFLATAYGRNRYSEEFFRKNEVKNIICLAETQKIFDEYRKENEDEFLDYLKDGHVQFLNISENYRSKESAKAVAKALLNLSRLDGPYGICCIMGINRTGFTVMLLMALAGCSEEELVKEMMQSYLYCYNVNEEKYAFIKDYKANEYIEYLKSYDSDFQKASSAYLRFGGLDDREIMEIRNRFAE